RTLNRDAPFEVAESGHRLDESRVGKHHTVGKDHDVLETELDCLPHRLEKALVDGWLATQEGQVRCTGSARLFERLDDRFERNRTSHLHRGELATRAEHATVVAKVAKLDLEAVTRSRGGDVRRRAEILSGNIG